MTLNKIIAALSACPDQVASIEIDGQPPGDFDSYRGYYDQLALGTGISPMTVGELLTAAIECVNKSFEGYRGGDFVMHGDTPVWAADHGFCPGIAIVAIDASSDPVQLITADISEYA